MATSTPWGSSQYSKQYGKGIVYYGTAGHGGFHVSATLLVHMPDYLKTADGYADGTKGWFEEDCAWSLVVTAFPGRFDDKMREEAKETLRHTYPEVYERHYGVTLQPGESHKRDEQLFLQAHANDYLVLAAWGDWHEKVPEGFVGVFAGRGGRTASGGYPADTKYFLVPDAEYQMQSGHFVVNPAVHQEVGEIG